MKASEIRKLIIDTKDQRRYDSRKEVEYILCQLIDAIKDNPDLKCISILDISLHAKEILTLPESEGGYGYTINQHKTGICEYTDYLY